MEIKNVERLYNFLIENNYPLFSNIMVNEYMVDGKKYADKEFLVQDPDGYLLRFSEE